MRMRQRRGKVVFLLLTAMVLLLSNQALAQHGCNTGGGGNWIDQFVNPNASGAKVSGSLTLYYTPLGINGNCRDGGTGGLFDFAYVFRVITTSNQSPLVNQYLPFSGVTHTLCFDDIDSQSQIIRSFINTKIVPTLFPSFTKWDFKNYGALVEPPDTSSTGCCGGMEWMMLDFTLAVK